MFVYLLLISLAVVGCVPVQHPQPSPGRDPFLLGTPDMDQFTGMSGGGGGVVLGPQGQTFYDNGQGLMTGPRGETWVYTR